MTMHADQKFWLASVEILRARLLAVATVGTKSECARTWMCSAHLTIVLSQTHHKRPNVVPILIEVALS